MSFRDRSIPGDGLDPRVARALRDDVGAPDLTRAIMGRLGYMKAVPEAARLARNRRFARRGLTVATFVAFLGLALEVHDHSHLARRPAEAISPEASFDGDVERLRDLIRPLRDLGAPFRRSTQPAAPVVEPVSEPAEPVTIDEPFFRMV